MRKSPVLDTDIVRIERHGEDYERRFTKEWVIYPDSFGLSL